MENKNTVIDAKIGDLNELTKVLSVKEQAQEQLFIIKYGLNGNLFNASALHRSFILLTKSGQY